MSNFKTFITGILIMGSTVLTAQNVKEALQDHQQIHVDKSTLARDEAEIEAFEMHGNSLKLAISSRDIPNAKKHHAVLLNSMSREINQTEVKISRAKREVVQSSQEIATDRRENRRNRRQYVGSKDDHRDIARDRRDMRDDKRDKKDDVLDLKELEARLVHQKSLFQSLQNVAFSDLNKVIKLELHKNIIQKFFLTMKADLAETKEELREDKRELSEDRRERRDDRRERREKY
ncbi:hypothetical protein [Sediminicola sp. 1XM1-17]|uniref:hypothetical protein n=1 Tax=Sediminicola sp. 1XM1-17 TaxID=3127702 RepID=UPI0030773C95